MEAVTAVPAGPAPGTTGVAGETLAHWRYKTILLAADASELADRATIEATALAALWGSRVTAAHVYAARLHDRRFRQMEGGLPEPYRAEAKLTEQRAVHNELIERGLRLIADSYLDQAEAACRATAVRFTPLSLEGKNYRALLEEANSGRHDLLALGALGLGATGDSRLGSVCERVARRATVDLLVIKNPQRPLSEGPITVAVDGSAHAWGALMTAFALARAWNVPIEVVAAYDPFFHYNAFRRINTVLSQEARKVFRFEEQERLHEEIIDKGLARIYQGHLEVAQALAEEQKIAIETRLLEGKPADAIVRHLRERRPTLLALGRLGVHADAGLDIGAAAEYLLRAADCAVLLGARTHTPRAELVAETTIFWTQNAEARLARIPDFVRPMARLAILRHAQDQGHTVITDDLVREAMKRLCPHGAPDDAAASTREPPAPPG